MIRPIMPKDVFDVADLAERMHGESCYKHIEFNKKKLINIMLNAMANMALVGFIDDKGKNIVGMIIGVLDTFYFSDKYLLSGRGFHVAAEYRQTKTGVKLLRKYIATAKKIGVHQINMDSSCAENYESLDKLLTTVGFKKVGSVRTMDF